MNYFYLMLVLFAASFFHVLLSRYLPSLINQLRGKIYFSMLSWKSKPAGQMSESLELRQGSYSDRTALPIKALRKNSHQLNNRIDQKPDCQTHQYDHCNSLNKSGDKTCS